MNLNSFPLSNLLNKDFCGFLLLRVPTEFKEKRLSLDED